MNAPALEAAVETAAETDCAALYSVVEAEEAESAMECVVSEYVMGASVGGFSASRLCIRVNQ